MRKKKKPTRSKSKGYLQYSKSSLHDAYTAVVEKKMSMYQASKRFHVPYMTLHDRVKGRIAMGTPMGRRGMLTVEQEKTLVDYFKFLMSIGYGYSKSEFLQIVTDQAVHCGSKKKKGKVKVGKIWYYNFLKRHQDVSSVRPHQRPACATKAAIHKYYIELEQFLKKHGLVNKPHATFVMDKVHLACEEPQEKQKDDRSEEDSESETPTVNSVVVVIAAGNCAWNQLPPFFVFPEESKLPRVTDTTPGTSGCVSAVSWVDGDVLMKYLFEHFLPLARSSGADDSLVLLYDGHKFPMFPGLIDWAQDKKLYLFPLPPHASCIQKSGISILAEFDDVYTQELQTMLRRDRDIDISKNTACQISCQAYLKVVLQDVLKTFFLKSGVIPFDPLAMTWPTHKPLNLERVDKTSVEESDQSGNDETGESEDSDCFLVPNIKSMTPVKHHRKNKPKKRKDDSNQSDKPKESKKSKRAKTRKTYSSDDSLSDSGSEGSGAKEPEKDIELDYACESEASSGEASVRFGEEEQKCCVCGKLEPPGLAGEVTTVIVEWVQCDACSHWTHLRFCTKVGVVNSEEEFKCPHCAPPRREII